MLQRVWIFSGNAEPLNMTYGLRFLPLFKHVNGTANPPFSPPPVLTCYPQDPIFYPAIVFQECHGYRNTISVCPAFMWNRSRNRNLVSFPWNLSSTDTKNNIFDSLSSHPGGSLRDAPGIFTRERLTLLLKPR